MKRKKSKQQKANGPLRFAQLQKAKQTKRSRTVCRIQKQLDKLTRDGTTVWDAGKNEPPLEMPKGGWQLLYKTTVRGHWRNQAWGPNRSRRKLLWIRPHTRGPEGATLVAHDYYTKEA